MLPSRIALDFNLLVDTLQSANHWPAGWDGAPGPDLTASAATPWTGRRVDHVDPGGHTGSFRA